MKKIVLLSLLLLANSLHSYTQEQAKRHTIIAAKCIAGIFCAFHMLQSIHSRNEIFEDYQMFQDLELANALLKLTIASGALSFFAFKSAYNDIKSS